VNLNNGDIRLMFTEDVYFCKECKMLDLRQEEDFASLNESPNRANLNAACQVGLRFGTQWKRPLCRPVSTHM